MTKIKDDSSLDTPGARKTACRVRSLADHPEPFIKTEDLARYWAVSRKQIYKQIEIGNLPAIRLGPRSLRIPTSEAAAFERRSIFGSSRSTTPEKAAPTIDRTAAPTIDHKPVPAKAQAPHSGLKASRARERSG